MSIALDHASDAICDGTVADYGGAVCHQLANCGGLFCRLHHGRTTFR